LLVRHVAAVTVETAVRARHVVSALCLVLGTVSLVAGLALGAGVHAPLGVGATGPARAGAASPAARASATPTPVVEPATPAPAPTPTPTPAPTPRSFDQLRAQVQDLLRSAGADGAVTMVELNGGAAWALGGDESFVAASTYKLPLLMEEAQAVTGGRASGDDQLCYEPGDWEDGYFSDYAPGACFTRAELERRVGTYSDNTAAHILVRVDGGGDALNAYARAHGATESEFWDPNVTSSNDLAHLWQNEASGAAGGAAAQQYLYPLLTHTAYEDGIPAGVPSGATVVHKIGILDGELNDAGLVLSGPRGPYVLTICTVGGSWSLLADVASAVAGYEAG
jgi:beta-lactamase class A